MNRRLAAGAALIAASMTIAACGNDTDSTTETTEETTTETTEVAAGQDVTLENPVVRAMEAGKGMTGVFGTLTNHTDEDINIVEFSTDLGATMYELHETVDGIMQEVEGGFVVPANGTYVLEPGADHFMIMGYDEAIEAGDTINVSFKDADGNEYTVEDVPVRTLIPGEENYGEDGQLTGHQPGHDMHGH
ncbi:copper chaperone PCu(A)C [Corynebacterium cystitidis]|uniref:copper chaperone PCu(A)C n=1 Tax=Corynebacterium cystitidis TaxID=35757 RepID=UPI00211DA5F3|nr:copper chaperone PCu(A)C [Corynebacterium cystitidis]